MTDWQPGDLALCVMGGDLNPGVKVMPEGFPQAGRIYLVESVGVFRFFSGMKAGLGLVDGPKNIDGTREWGARRFVKVTPGHKIKGVEVEKRLSAKVSA